MPAAPAAGTAVYPSVSTVEPTSSPSRTTLVQRGDLEHCSGALQREKQNEGWQPFGSDHARVALTWDEAPANVIGAG